MWGCDGHYDYTGDGHMYAFLRQLDHTGGAAFYITEGETGMGTRYEERARYKLLVLLINLTSKVVAQGYGRNVS